MSDYNRRPEGWKEISEDEFRMGFFSYCLKSPEFRQILYNEENIMEGIFNAKLFRLDYVKTDLGYALINDWKEMKVKFFKFGNNWEDFEKDFASQFSGDNS